SGRPPQEHRHGCVVLDQAAQRTALAQQVALTGDLVQVTRPHAYGQGLLALGGLGPGIVEERFGHPSRAGEVGDVRGGRPPPRAGRLSDERAPGMPQVAGTAVEKVSGTLRTDRVIRVIRSAMSSPRPAGAISAMTSAAASGLTACSDSACPTLSRPSCMLTSELSTRPSEHSSRVGSCARTLVVTVYSVSGITPRGGPVSGAQMRYPWSVARTTGG